MRWANWRLLAMIDASAHMEPARDDINRIGQLLNTIFVAAASNDDGGEARTPSADGEDEDDRDEHHCVRSRRY